MPRVRGCAPEGAHTKLQIPAHHPSH